MSYRMILVHVDDSRRANERISIAASIALAKNAHLIGVAMTGISTVLYPVDIIDADARTFTPILESLQERANRALAEFESAVRRMGIASFEKRLVADEMGGGLILQARYCDLVVIGQSDPSELSPVVPSDFPEYVVMNAARPVLIIPYAGHFSRVGKRPLVAWDASMAATRAIADAIPFLQHAEVVDVVVFNPKEQSGVHGDQPGADIALYLARHDIKVNVTQQTTTIPVGEALLSLTADIAADMIVMGGYGHARFREILLGGVTRTILGSMTVPVLMSH